MPPTIQLIEADRLSNPAGVQDSKTLRSGIEIDAYGAAVAYHIRKTHPGDAYIGYGQDREEWLRVPVRTLSGGCVFYMCMTRNALASIVASPC
jgi:capsid protein